MDRDNASATATATQPDSGGMTRRGVMRRTAIGVGAAATLGAVGTGSVAAINLPSRDTVITAAGFTVSPILAASYYVGKRVSDFVTGSDVDSELSALNATETHASIESDLREMGSVEDRVLTSIGNVVDGIDRRSYQKGIEKALNRLDAGDSQADVKSKAVDAAKNSIATPQKNLVDHWSIQVQKLDRLMTEIANTNNLAQADVIEVFSPDDTVYNTTVAEGGTGTASVSLVNGDSYSHTTTKSGSGTARTVENNDTNIHYTKAYPESSGGTFRPFEYYRYYNLWNDIQSIASTVETEINTWVDGIYDSYTAGDVNLDELVTSDQLAATASEQNDLSNVTADFATLGIPINDATTLTIEIVSGDNSGTVIDGNLATSNPPTDGFIVGDTYDPANISSPVWMMYDRTKDDGTTEGDVVALSGKFKVINAEDYNGDPVSNVTFEEQTKKRYSTDIQTLNEELDRLAQLQQDIQDERDALIEEETSTGGGGGFLSGGAGDIRTLGIVAGGAALAALLFGNN